MRGSMNDKSALGELEGARTLRRSETRYRPCGGRRYNEDDQFHIHSGQQSLVTGVRLAPGAVFLLASVPGNSY